MKFTLLFALIVLVACATADNRPNCREDRGEVLVRPGRSCENMCGDRPKMGAVKVCTNSRRARCICNPKDRCRDRRSRQCRRSSRRG